MQNFQKYLLAANDDNLFETNDNDKSKNYFVASVDDNAQDCFLCGVL